MFGAWEHSEPYVLSDFELSSVHFVVMTAWVFSCGGLCLVSECFLAQVGSLTGFPDKSFLLYWLDAFRAASSLSSRLFRSSVALAS